MLVQLNGKGCFELQTINSNQFINVNGKVFLIKHDDMDQAYIIVECNTLLVTYF